jgi:hypothetical protein
MRVVALSSSAAAIENASGPFSPIARRGHEINPRSGPF